MRWMVVVLILLSGCFDPTANDWQCSTQGPVEEGLRLQLLDYEPVIGRCIEAVQTSSPNGQWDGDHAARVLVEVPRDGLVWVPLQASGTYVVTVHANDWDDRDCVYEWGAIVDFAGGLVERTLVKERVCN